MPNSLRNTAAAAVRALQEWYGADSYASSTGLYTWDATDADIDSYVPISPSLNGIIKTTGNWNSLRDTACWWNSANAITALIDYMLVTGDRTYLDVVDNTFNKAPGAYTINVGGAIGGGIGGAIAGAAAGAGAGWALCDGPCAVVGGIAGGILGAILGGSPSTDPIARTYYSNFLDEFYDDEGWWALAWLKAYDLTGNNKYLEMAITIFSDMMQGWDNVCNGGLYWQKNHKDPNSSYSPYKNAIVNELFLAAATGIYKRTSDDFYKNWAIMEGNWFLNIGLINPQHLVNDSLSAFCTNIQTTSVFTYNQGVILGGLCDLAEITGNSGYIERAEQIADALIQNPVSPNSAPPESGVLNGILTEWTYLKSDESVGDCQMKGIFIRNLGYLATETHNSKYSAFIRKNAAAAIQHQNAFSQYAHRWDAFPDKVDFIRQTAALDLLNAALSVQAIAPDQSFLDPLLLNGAQDRRDLSYLDPLLLSGA